MFLVECTIANYSDIIAYKRKSKGSYLKQHNKQKFQINAIYKKIIYRKSEGDRVKY